jgi:DNA-binding MarR family transcriptional regulator
MSKAKVTAPVDWVAAHSKARCSTRAVLLCIARHAHCDGTNSWPKVATIAQGLGVTTRTVARAIVRLQELGELHVERRRSADGRWSTTAYRVVMDPDEQAHLAREARRERALREPAGLQQWLFSTLDGVKVSHGQEGQNVARSGRTECRTVRKDRMSHGDVARTIGRTLKTGTLGISLAGNPQTRAHVREGGWAEPISEDPRGRAVDDVVEAVRAPHSGFLPADDEPPPLSIDALGGARRWMPSPVQRDYARIYREAYAATHGGKPPPLPGPSIDIARLAEQARQGGTDPEDLRRAVEACGRAGAAGKEFEFVRALEAVQRTELTSSRPGSPPRQNPVDERIFALLRRAQEGHAQRARGVSAHVIQDRGTVLAPYPQEESLGR